MYFTLISLSDASSGKLRDSRGSFLVLLVLLNEKFRSFEERFEEFQVFARGDGYT